MKTKSFLHVLMVAICGLMLSGLMTSCRQNPNDPEDPKTQDTTPAFARAEAIATVSEDILALMDVTVEYYNDKGELKQELLTTPELKYEVKAPLPTRTGMCLRVKLKDDANLESYEQVDLSTSFAFRCAAVTKEDKIVGEEHRFDGGSSTVKLKSAGVEAWINSFNKHLPIKFLYEFDAEGNSQSVDW